MLSLNSHGTVRDWYSEWIYFLQGAEYEVLDDTQEHWWKVKDEQG
jgi:hypothetical protein